LHVTIDGVAHTIALPAGPTPLDDVVDLINAGLTTGQADLTTAAPADRLIIMSSVEGLDGSVTVGHNATLGFAADTTVTGHDDATNNVGDIAHVTVDDLNSLFIADSVAVRARVDSQTGRTVLTSTATGSAATVSVRGGVGSENNAVGLVTGQTATGVNGSAVSYFIKSDTGWRGSTNAALDPTALATALANRTGVDLLTIALLATDADGNQTLYEDLAFDPAHPRWMGHVLAAQPTRRSDALQNLYEARIGRNVDPFELRDGLFGADDFALLTLQQGSDGPDPTAEAYRRAIQAFESIEDISIVAAPDAAAFDSIIEAVNNDLITHAERRRAYRIAVLDTPQGLLPTEALELRGTIDTTRAALYYPWVVIPNPLAVPSDASIPTEIAVPPSGFICGIYARSDNQRGVFKAPANEVVLGALRFESDINFAQQELLNPAGVNCLRFFPGRGYRVWGARTASSDPEWKYVNIRRYFNYLERSIDNSTQWVVFEPNGERLWANIRETVSSFLYNEWTTGALLGASPKEAFFVRCDRSTMTQNDLDNGRLICLIGVAAIKPAEFVIFRIGQKTADATP
ncbi:MAG TPA: phage tail sheath subtilisin-like domain-containing protein, partial [Gemmatimonadaceae bacterium]|nr:phage tail sheath subtilisin-like domain-containing protein [Gemmatimonadaceae bacterium]